MRYFFKTHILTWFTLLGFLNAYPQNNYKTKESDLKLIKESFVALSDSLLILNDTLNEFKPLYELSKKKSFVAIGEATHGTDEIRKIQLIMARGLVLEANFKAVALAETPLLESYPLFDFVVNKRGTLKNISNMFQFDISSLLTWLSQYNSTKPFNQKVWLLGGGVDTPDKIIDFVSVHCKIYNYKNSNNLITRIKNIFSSEVNSTKTYIDSLNVYKSQLISILHANKGIADSLDFKLDCMIRSVNTLTDIFINRDNSLTAFQQRDHIIFNNMEWIFNSKGKTAIILAHNLHINKKTLTKDIYTNSSKPFGEYLSEKFNQRYLSIGTEVQKGFFSNGTAVKEKIIDDPQKLGSIIGSAVADDFGFILFDEKLRSFFNTSGLKITKGTSKSFLVEGNGLLGDAFDGIIYIKSSSPYTFYNKEDYCMLFLDLDSDFSSDILERKKILLSAQYETSKNFRENAVSYSIYLNDENKKVLKHYVKPIIKDGQDMVFEIPEQTKYISISIVLRKLDYFKLNSLKINNQSQNLKKLGFYDWNNIGYKFKSSKNNILIIK